MDNDNNGNTCSVHIGIIEFHVDQLCKLPLQEKRKWYSSEARRPSLKYRIASTKTGDIVHFVGPFRGAIPDRTIFRCSLRGTLRPCEKVGAVNAEERYLGDQSVATPDYCTTCREGLARHERIFARLRSFGLMDAKWMHESRKHQLAFRACLVLVQLSHEWGDNKSH